MSSCDAARLISSSSSFLSSNITSYGIVGIPLTSLLYILEGKCTSFDLSSLPDISVGSYTVFKILLHSNSGVISFFNGIFPVFFNI